MAALLSQKSTLPLATPPQLQTYISGLESKVSALTLKLEGTKSDLGSCREELSSVKVSHQSNMRKKDASLSHLRSRYAELRSRYEEVDARAGKLEREKKERQRFKRTGVERKERKENGGINNGIYSCKTKNYNNGGRKAKASGPRVVEVDLALVPDIPTREVEDARFMRADDISTRGTWTRSGVFEYDLQLDE